jgi:hypothetical protein
VSNNVDVMSDAQRITAVSANGVKVGEFPSQDDFERAMIYAQYGQTIALAQLLQRDVVNALMLMRIIEPNLPTLDQLKRFIDHQESATFQTLLSRLREFADIPTELGELLSRAIHRSNYLSHQIFADNDTTHALATRKGRSILFQKLGEDKELFRETARKFEQAIEPIRKTVLSSDRGRRDD